MTTIITREVLVALVKAHDAARIADHRSGEGDVDTSTADLGTVLGTGNPASEAFADSLGRDYICALDDGTIAAWGGDTLLAPGLIGRDLVFYGPADQVVDAE